MLDAIFGVTQALGEPMQLRRAFGASYLEMTVWGRIHKLDDDEIAGERRIGQGRAIFSIADPSVAPFDMPPAAKDVLVDAAGVRWRLDGLDDERSLGTGMLYKAHVRPAP